MPSIAELLGPETSIDELLGPEPKKPSIDELLGESGQPSGGFVFQSPAQTDAADAKIASQPGVLARTHAALNVPTIPADLVTSTIAAPFSSPTGAGIMSPTDNKSLQAVQGGIDATGDVVSGFSTPENIALLLATGPAGKVGQRLIAGIFEGQALWGAPEQIKALKEAKTLREQVRIGGGLLLGTGLPAAGFLSTFRGSKARSVDVADAARSGEQASPQSPSDSQGNRNVAETPVPAETNPLSAEQEIFASQASQPEAATGTAESQVSPNDYVPALRTKTEFVVGDKGQTHQNIYDAQPDATELRANDPEHGFWNNKTNKFETRAQVSEALGETKPMQSERLRDLQNETHSGKTGSGLSGKEKGSGPVLGESPQSAPSDAGSGVDATGISQRINEARGTGVEPGTGISPEEAVNLGREDLKAGADPEAIATKIDRGEAITSRETGIMRAHIEDLDRAYDRAQEAADKNPALKPDAEAAFRASNDFRRRIKPAATEWHAIGQTMQGEVNVETGTFSGLRRMVNELHGRDVRPDEVPKLRTKAEKVKAKQQSEDVVRRRIDAALQREAKANPPKTPDELRAHFAKKLKSLLPC